MGITAVLDTNIFLNVKNKEEPYFESSRRVLDAVDDGKLQAVVSVISIAELCSGYYSAGDEKGRQALIMHLVSSKGYIIMELDLRFADTAGRIKAETGLRLPDAIMIASGLARGASYIDTHDEEFRKAHRYLSVVTSEELIERLG